MTIKEVKEEVYYYTGKRVDDDLAFEILDYIEAHPQQDHAEIVQGYFVG